MSPLPLLACQDKQLHGHKEDIFCQDLTQICPHASSVTATNWPWFFPSGLLDLFLMCIYKEFTVGKELGLPQSAIWVFFFLLCTYLSIRQGSVPDLYCFAFWWGWFLCSGVLLSMLCALDTLSSRLRCYLSDAVGLEALSSKFTHKWEPEMQICDDTLRVSLWIRAFSLPQVIQLLLLSALFFFLPSLIVI